MKRLLGISALVLLVGSMAGCSANPEQTPEAGTPEPGVEAEVLSDFLCSADDDGVWRGKATLTNVGTAANTYTVRFSVGTSTNTSAAGMHEEDFALQAGESTDVAFADIATNTSPEMECRAHVTAQPAQ